LLAARSEEFKSIKHWTELKARDYDENEDGRLVVFTASVIRTVTLVMQAAGASGTSLTLYLTARLCTPYDSPLYFALFISLEVTSTKLLSAIFTDR
jgi:hypothetical protein